MWNLSLWKSSFKWVKKKAEQKRLCMITCMSVLNLAWAFVLKYNRDNLLHLTKILNYEVSAMKKENNRLTGPLYISHTAVIYLGVKRRKNEAVHIIQFGLRTECRWTVLPLSFPDWVHHPPLLAVPGRRSCACHGGRGSGGYSSSGADTMSVFHFHTVFLILFNKNKLTQSMVASHTGHVQLICTGFGGHYGLEYQSRVAGQSDGVNVSLFTAEWKQRKKSIWMRLAAIWWLLAGCFWVFSTQK